MNPVDTAMLDFSEVSKTYLTDECETDLSPELWSSFLRYRDALKDWHVGRQLADRKYHQVQRTIELLAAPDSIEKCYFVTLNPDEKHVSLPQFIVSVNRWCKNKIVNDLAYCYEQRGSEDLDTQTGGSTMGNGYHCHMLVYTNKARSILLQRLKQCFNNTLIDVPPKPTTDIEAKLLYMRGVKSDEKMGKVSYDAPWRVKEGLPDIINFQRPPCVENPTRLLLD